jgi:hypothetical protein
MIRGPYWTGAVTPSGACAFVSQPHPHFTVSIWCSVVTALTGCMSVTCLRSTAATGAFFRDFPQQEHLAGRSCRAATSATASPARPTTGASMSSASSSSPGRRDPRPATAARPAARAAPRSPRPAPLSGRPARPAAPAAACSQREARHHRCRERRASRARPNAATTPPRPQIGRHRSDWTRRESTGSELDRQTDLSSYKSLKHAIAASCGKHMTYAEIRRVSRFLSWFMSRSRPRSPGVGCAGPAPRATARPDRRR